MKLLNSGLKFPRDQHDHKKKILDKKLSTLGEDPLPKWRFKACLNNFLFLVFKITFRVKVHFSLSQKKIQISP